MITALAPGLGRFVFRGPQGAPIVVWYYRPSYVGPGSRVLFVFHGANRNAKEYLQSWIEVAESRGALALAPEFSSRWFPGAEDYNMGGVLDRWGRLRPASEWSYSVVEQLADQVTRVRGLPYLAFGHSAGAQFLHRALLLGCLPTVGRVVVSNAGWYTFPRQDQDFPYGLSGLPTDSRVRAFRTPVLLLLGELDTEDDPFLRKTSEAMRQGANRLVRGKSMHRVAAGEAESMGVPFDWKLKVLPDVGHHGPSMVPAAADWLFARD